MTAPLLRLYDYLASAFVAEGVTCHFTLLGDGNMHWAIRLGQLGVRLFHVRHEHCACAMATSYANATGEVGSVSVTCGPGLTQILTALPAAVRAQIPLVVFAGESPLRATWYNQHIDQAPLVTATGASYISAHEIDRIPELVRMAFLRARETSQPVVLGVPLDLQQRSVNLPLYCASSQFLIDAGHLHPDPSVLQRVADLVETARSPIIIAGRGAKRAGARQACEELADVTGAYLTTTLPVRGLFNGNPFDLGLAGGFAADATRQAFSKADVIIAVGARMAHHTTEGGKLFPGARVVQIDTAPLAEQQGHRSANLHLRADAAVGAKALADLLKSRSYVAPSWRDESLRQRLISTPPDDGEFLPDGDAADPRDAVAMLDSVLPKDWHIVNGSAHSSYFAAHMHGRDAEHFHTIREFGAIGNGLPYAMGVAAAYPNQPVVMIDGDGGTLMHIQELETVARHGLRILICVLNDGAFGSEIHKLRADGIDDAPAMFGRGDIAAIARGFGLDGHKIDDPGQMPALFEAFHSGRRAMLWDIAISSNVCSPALRKLHAAMKH